MNLIVSCSECHASRDDTDELCKVCGSSQKEYWYTCVTCGADAVVPDKEMLEWTLQCKNCAAEEVVRMRNKANGEPE